MCEIIDGRDEICDSVGGVRRVVIYSLKDSAGQSNYLIEPTIVEGEVTAMSLKPGKFAHVFNVDSETAKGGTNSIGEKGNAASAFEHMTTMLLAGNTKEDIAQAAAICKGRIAVILEQNDGSYELYHYEKGFGGKLQRARDTGTALVDRNGSTWTITSNQISPEAKISSVLVASLLQP